MALERRGRGRLGEAPSDTPRSLDIPPVEGEVLLKGLENE